MKKNNVDQQEVQVDFEQMPSWQKEDLFDATLEAVKRYTKAKKEVKQ